MAKRSQHKRAIQYFDDFEAQTQALKGGKRSRAGTRKSKRLRNQQTTAYSASGIPSGNPGSNILEFNRKLDTAYSPHLKKSPLEARTPAQQQYINAIKSNCLTFGIGPAGTGKSYCAGALAAQALESGRIERIIFTRPAVEAGEKLGFLPGDLEDKFAVYIDSFRDILNERLGKGVVDYCLRHGRIIGAPLAYMRGKTFNQATFVILDEAQNITPVQMKMFLTRIGENCKVVVNGDINQSDISGPNGLVDAIDRLRGVRGVHIHTFEREDTVRSGLVKDVLDRYEN